MLSLSITHCLVPPLRQRAAIKLSVGVLGQRGAEHDLLRRLEGCQHGGAVAQELLRIWQTERRTVIFVTHDIDEAVQLADRVVVLTARPARIADIVPVDLPRPRNLDAAAYLEARDRIFQAMGNLALIRGG